MGTLSRRALGASARATIRRYGAVAVLALAGALALASSEFNWRSGLLAVAGIVATLVLFRQLVSRRSANEERDFVNALLEGLPGYFALVDAGGRLVRWNGALRSLNGRTDADLAGSNPFANVVADDRAKTVDKVREAIENGSAVLEFRISSLQGIRDLRFQGRRITVDGKPHVLAIGVDLTDLYSAEAVRRAAEERFRDIFAAAKEGIIIQDSATGAFIDVNPHMCDLLGYTRAEFLALDPIRMSVASPAEALARRASLVAETSPQASTFEWLCRTKDGREIWCEISSRHITNFGGRDVILMMVRDISEQRAALEAITYRDRILHALTVSTAELVKASSLTGAMEGLLKAVGEELNVDRLLVLQRHGTPGTAGGEAVAYSWERDGVPQVELATMASVQAVGRLEIDAWFAPLRDGKIVRTYASSATGVVAQILRNNHTISNLQMSIFVGGVYWGHFGVDDTRAVRAWTSIEIDALTTLSAIVGAMIARDRSSRALLQSEQQFRTVSDTVLDGIIMIDTGGHIRYWNRAAEGIFGYASSEAVGKQIHAWLAPPRFREMADRGMAGFVETGRGALLGRTVELAAIRKDGVEIAVEFKINPMSVGSDRFAVGIVRDVTARNEASAVVEHMATHDLLTDLPNRRFFIDALDAAIARANRSGHQFAVLYLDLDRFKDVNDTLGHPVGDQLLQAVAARLLSNMRTVDIVSRFGGDEFAAIQIGINDPADAAMLATKIVEILAEPFDIDGNEIRSGASIGIAIYGPDSPDAESLLAHADAALYLAKADGRAKYHFYTESMDTAVRERVGLERELRDALTAGQFFLVYQPQVDLNDGRIVGVEALVRWQHPARGVISPGSFIPAAEKSGLIVALGAWVFHEACRQTRRWIDDGIAPPIVAVNLSALQFRAPQELEQSIAATLAEFGIAAAQIELELTESVMMQATQQHRDLLVRLRSTGFRMAIDDFGTGYSSLEYLQRFHVDRIKIPQIFIQDLGLVPESATIVRATIGLAHELGITVVAEAVETVGQLDVLRELGCRIVQGYYYSKPLSAVDAGNALRIGSLVPQLAELRVGAVP